MSSRNRRFFDDDDDDDSHRIADWTKKKASNGNISRDRRNGVSRDPLSEVQSIVQDHWRETLDENFLPITLALDILDTSSLGRAKELEDFKAVNAQIEKALQSTVDEHFQGFNSSVGTYGHVTGTVAETQKQVRGARDALLRAKVQLSSKRTDLIDLSAKSIELQNMINLLKQIAEIKQVPELLEAQLSAKHFLKAVEILNDGVSTADREELLAVPAINDIRQYLKAQSISLVEILVEELQNHLYLKSPYCDNRWMSYSIGQVDLPVIRQNAQQSPGEKKARSYSTIGKLEIEVHQSKGLPDDDDVVVLDNQHPEADSLSYVVVLVQALYSMAKLPYALEVIHQRLSLEISQTVLRTKQEVASRHRRADAQVSTGDLPDSDALDDNTESLRDLLWTLFSKWDAILQAHRALYDAVGRLYNRYYSDKRMSTSGTIVDYDFRDIWHPFELEIKTILNDYLTEKERKIHQKEERGALNELFTGRKSQAKRAGLFKLGQAKSSTEAQSFTADEQEMREMLKDAVPGLLSEKNEPMSRSSANTTESAVERIRLAQASPLNIAALLKPTLAFLKRASRSIPHPPNATPQSISIFLDDFLEQVFHPQLAETVDTLYRDAIAGTHTSSTTMSSSYRDSRHMLDSTANVIRLMNELSFILSSMPHKPEIYAQSILSLIKNYHQTCAAWLTKLTANEQPGAHLGALKLGPAWAHRQQIHDMWTDYDILGATELSLYEAVASERATIFEIKQGFIIRETDLIEDASRIDGLVQLHRAVSSFEHSVSELQSASQIGSNKIVKFSTEGIASLSKLSQSFSTITKSILIILRMELRVHVLYHIQVALVQGNYNIEEKANEVDTLVADLNSDLWATCSPLHALSKENYHFLLAGLAMLINEVLIEDSDQISIMTKHGAEKLVLSISAIQQTLRNLVADPADADLTRAMTFFGQFQLGATGLAAEASARSSLDFTYDQVAKLMNLIYSVDLARDSSRTGNRESLSAKRKQMNEQLAVISTHMN